MIKETKDPFLHGDFDSMDVFTRVTVENAPLCFTAPNTKRDSVIPRTPEKSLETPPQCLRVIDQKWPLVVELIDLDRFSKK